MAGVTTRGYPYPDPADDLRLGAAKATELAQAIDTRIGVAASGEVSINVTALNTVTTVAVTFPAGRFGTAPKVVAAVGSGNPGNAFAGATAVTAAGFNAVGFKTGTTGALIVHWIAREGS